MVVLSTFCCSNKTFAQQNTYANTSLDKIFKDIEEQKNLKINFDPELISKYEYTGSLDFSDFPKYIKILLEDTPFIFEQNGDFILIALPDKQSYSLCGTIYSLPDSLPLSYANIYLSGTKIGENTDTQGNFSLAFDSYKNQSISISRVGYKNVVIRVDKWNKKGCPKTYLQEETYSLDLNLVILGYLIDGVSEGAEYGSIKFNYDELVKNYPFQEQDVLKTTQLLPGITSVNESSSNLNIRGSLPDQNLVLWEGVTLYDPGHVFGMISSINPFVVDKVDTYKSAYNPRYANRVGGIVDISLTDKINNSFNGSIGSTLTESHAFIHTPIIKDKLSVLLSGRQSTNAFFTSPTLNKYSDRIFQTTIIGEEGNATSLGFVQGDDQLNFYDWNGKILYKPNERLSISSSFFRSKNKFAFNAKTEGDDLESKESVLFISEAFSNRLSMKWSPIFSTEVFVNNSNYQNENNTLFTDNSESGFSYETLTSNKISDTEIGITNHFHFNKYYDFDLGYSYKNLHVNHFIDQSSSTEGEFNEEQMTNGHFHNLAPSFAIERSKFSMMAGLRASYYSELNKWFISPRIHLQYLINDYLKIKGSTGYFHQFINQNISLGNNTINATTGFWTLSNNESKDFLNSRKNALGFILEKNNWLLDIEGYAHKTKGISNFSINQNVEGIGSSEVIGLDILLRKKWKYFQSWFNYTISKNQNKFLQISSNEFPSNNDHLHNLSFYNNAKWGKWNFSLTYHFRSGLPYSTPSGIEPYISEGQQTTFYRLIYNQYNAKKLFDYQRLDFGVVYKTPLFKEKINLEIGGTIINLFDRKNIASREFVIGDVESLNEQKIISIEKYLLRRTPQITVRIHW